MSKSENEKWIATIPTQSSANSGKIDFVSDLLVPYSELSAYFLKDIDLRFIRDNALLNARVGQVIIYPTFVHVSINRYVHKSEYLIKKGSRYEKY